MTKPSAFQLKYSQLFAHKKTLVVAGGGGAGNAYPSALMQAELYGLSLPKIEEVVCCSVGSILGLGLALGFDAKGLDKVLTEMPTHEFQDWSIWDSIAHFAARFGWCRGKRMAEYFRELILKRTGLLDPTFSQLMAWQQAALGRTVDLRVIITNTSKGNAVLCSVKHTPDMRVSDAIHNSCSLPFIFPTQFLIDAGGNVQQLVDGGLQANFPISFRNSQRHDNEVLGITFVNSYNPIMPTTGGAFLSIGGLMSFLMQICRVLFISDPLNIPPPKKLNTIPLEIYYDPMNFAPTKQQRQRLHQEAVQSVEKYVQGINDRYFAVYQPSGEKTTGLTAYKKQKTLHFLEQFMPPAHRQEPPPATRPKSRKSGVSSS